MWTSKLEVLVELGPTSDDHLLNKTLNELKSQDGIKEAVFKNGAIIVDTTLPSSVVLDLVSRTSGKRAVLQGFGDTQSAVAMMTGQSESGSVMGVIRFQQTAGDILLADGSIHGLPLGLHGLHIHDTGDLSQGCESIGGHYNPLGSPHGGPQDPIDRRHAGDLGNIEADENGRATFRIENNLLKVSEIIGRSVAVTENVDDLGKGDSVNSKVDGDSGKPIACGIIARSAGIFQNPKRICACDGVVVWDERDKPLAGKGRRDDLQKENNPDVKNKCCKKQISGINTNVKPCCKV